MAQLVNGEVAWVDVNYLPTSIRPQRNTSFNFTLTDLSIVQPVSIPGLWNDNGRDDTVDASFALPSTVESSSTGDPAIHVVVTTFTREMQIMSRPLKLLAVVAVAVLALVVAYIMRPTPEPAVFVSPISVEIRGA